MTSKERVKKALRFEKADRVPRFIWLGAETRRRLMERYNVSSLQLDFKLGNDILQAWVSINGEMEREAEQGATFVDEWGITWLKDGIYNSVVRHPLKDLSYAEIEKYPFPDPYEPNRYKYLKEILVKYGEEYFIGADVSGSLFEPAYHLRGMEDLMVDMLTGDETAGIILDKIMDFTLKTALECVRLGVDWIWLGDDLGSQQNMLMSPELWREYFKPRMAKIIAEIKRERPDIPVAYHSCGSMSPVIPDLVEIGVNVLNPIQESAAGMNQREIKEKYGTKLALMCGLDTQTFLIKATANEVKAELARLERDLGGNGGYILAASHHIQPDTPIENIEKLIRS
jgi:uroporphyrinogen decarboxylase